MTQASAQGLLRHILRLSAMRENSTTDEQLLQRFVASREADAFEEIVRRHGPMVLGVSRRQLKLEQDIEDVFRAAFFALARRASAIRHRQALAAWLHGVARRLAVDTIRRATQPLQDVAGPIGHPADDLSWREVRVALDEELTRLPAKHRAALVSCYLQGLTRDEAAARLGIALGTLKGRLERGRELLRQRLTRRGITLPAALATIAVDRVALPARTAATIARASLQFATGSPTAAESAVALARTMLWPASLKRFVTATACALSITIFAVGTRLLVTAPPTENAATPPNVAGNQPLRVDTHGDPLPKGAIGRLGSVQLQIGNSAFALAPNGKTVVAVSPQGVVKTFDAESGKLLSSRQITDRHTANPMGQGQVQLSTDGATAAIRAGDVSVWDVASGKLLLRPQVEKGRTFGYFALAPNGKQLALTENGQTENRRSLRVYDIASGIWRKLGNVEFNVNDILFSADATRLVLSQISRIPRRKRWLISTSRPANNFGNYRTKVWESISARTGVL